MWNLVLARDLHNGDQTTHLILSELSCPLGEVDVCFLQHHISIFLPHNLNCCDGKCYFPLAIDNQPLIVVLTSHEMCWKFSGSLDTWMDPSSAMQSSCERTIQYIFIRNKTQEYKIEMSWYKKSL